MTGSAGPFGRGLPRRFRFAQHLALFAVAGCLLLVAEVSSGEDWPLFWPLGSWGAAVAMHYLVASAYAPDEAWIEERVDDLRARSYDFDHIQNIEQRIRDHDDSVTAPTERGRPGG